jgi:hypothetical protein
MAPVKNKNEPLKKTCQWILILTSVSSGKTLPNTAIIALQLHIVGSVVGVTFGSTVNSPAYQWRLQGYPAQAGGAKAYHQVSERFGSRHCDRPVQVEQETGAINIKYR